MSIWRRSAPRPEARAAGWQPTWPFTYGSSLGATYQNIDPTIGETALESVAFRTGADLIASIVSELPLVVYSGEGSATRKRSIPSYLDDPSGDGYGRQDWVYQWIMSWILRGNAFGHIIDQGPTGMIRQVDIWHPDQVSVHMDEGRPQWNVQGQTIPNGRMYHKRVNPVPGTLMGLSVIQAHAATLGLSLTGTAFGRSWFQDGAHPSGLLSNELSDLGDANAIQTIKDRFMAALMGTREPVVLGRGWKYQSIQISPEESQFLQTQGWSEAQCARILGAGVAEVLGYDTHSSMTYANMVDRDIALLKYAVGRWVTRINRLFSEWLPRPQMAKLDTEAFLETSAMAKWQLNQIKLNTGAATINEIRDRENQEPVEWGNKPFSMKSLEAPKAPESAPGDGGTSEDDPTDPTAPGEGD